MRVRPPKTVHVTTLGCSKNVYDSEILMGQLQYFGAELVDNPEEAEAIIINTCGFITPAKQESVDAILEAEALKNGNGDKTVVVCGCLSARYARELQKEIPAVDAFFGTEAFSDILRFLNFPVDQAPEYLYETRTLTTPPHYAYLKIGEGCNHTCAFCAIPLMRGRYRSRPISDIVAEAQQLASQGVKELIIISQDTTFYGLDLYKKQRLVDLLQELEAIPDIRWIRLHYLYPTTVQDALIEYMATSQKVVPYLDMPVQHITDRMLKIMKRGGNSRRIREIFRTARERIPGVTLRTTLIVGHPGETEADFEALKAFVQEMAFDRLGVFTYSHEEKTPAYQMEDLPEALKEARYDELMAIQRDIAFRLNEQLVGQTVEVIVDEVDREHRVAYARTPGDSPEIDNTVILEAVTPDVEPGRFYRVQLIDAREYDVFGKIIEAIP